MIHRELKINIKCEKYDLWINDSNRSTLRLINTKYKHTITIEHRDLVGFTNTSSLLLVQSMVCENISYVIFCANKFKADIPFLEMIFYGV